MRSVRRGHPSFDTVRTRPVLTYPMQTMISVRVTGDPALIPASSNAHQYSLLSAELRHRTAGEHQRTTRQSPDGHEDQHATTLGPTNAPASRLSLSNNQGKDQFRLPKLQEIVMQGRSVRQWACL